MPLPTITIIGKIQRKNTRQAGEKNVTSLSISCGEKNTKGDYDNFNVSADFWEKQADFVNKYFNENDYIIVTGQLITESYTNKDGVKVYTTKIRFPKASFVPTHQQAPTPTPTPTPTFNDDEIPF